MSTTSDVLATVEKVLLVVAQLGPTIIQVEENVKPFAEEILSLIKGNTVTDDELMAVEANVDRLHMLIQQSNVGEGE